MQVNYAPLVYNQHQGWDTALLVQNLSSTLAAKVKVYFLDTECVGLDPPELPATRYKVLDGGGSRRQAERWNDRGRASSAAPVALAAPIALRRRTQQRQQSNDTTKSCDQATSRERRVDENRATTRIRQSRAKPYPKALIFVYEGTSEQVSCRA